MPSKKSRGNESPSGEPDVVREIELCCGPFDGDIIKLSPTQKLQREMRFSIPERVGYDAVYHRREEAKEGSIMERCFKYDFDYSNGWQEMKG